MWSAPASASTRGLQAEQARFERTDRPDAPAQTVALPDTWSRRGEPPVGVGLYVIAFELEQPLTEPWSVYFERISASRQVWLNDSLIDARAPRGAQQPFPAVLDLPAALLRPGRNELRIEVHYRDRGGLSSPHIGPRQQLRDRFDAHALRWMELPRIGNIATLMQAAFAVLVFVWRRAERAMGFFGLSSALAALVNYGHHTAVLLVPPEVADVLGCAMQVGIVTMLVAFSLSQRTSPAPPRLWRWAVWYPTLVLPLLAGALSLWWDWQLLRFGLYPLLAALACGALFWAWQGARAQQARSLWAMVAALAVEVVASVHDYALALSLLPIEHAFWMPWAMPIAMTVFALIVLRRFARALTESEQLNIELEQRVAQRTQALEVANAAKTRFLSAASHDLRQPVVAISMFSGLLREQLTEPQQRHLGTRIYETAGALEAMLNGLLDLSRLESDMVRLNLAPVSLQDLFDSVALHESAAAQTKGLRLRMRPTALVVVSDAVLLEQVLRNLVSNAVRYTERGGVLVAARRQGVRGVRLQVWDTGCGIGAHEQTRIFDEFYQVANRARAREHGLGLGLSIVQRSLQRLGHALQLRSTLGRGSCFSLSLPRGVGASRAPIEPPLLASQLQGLRVVVVEDDPAVRESLSARLQAWGAQVQAFDGLPAWQAATRDDRPGPRPALLISDQRLPTDSGLAVVAWARQRWPGLPALLITGDTAPTDLDLLAASGVPVLHKPFRAEALLRAIQRELEPDVHAPQAIRLAA